MLGKIFCRYFFEILIFAKFFCQNILICVEYSFNCMLIRYRCENNKEFYKIKLMSGFLVQNFKLLRFFFLVLFLELIDLQLQHSTQSFFKQFL